MSFGPEKDRPGKRSGGSRSSDRPAATFAGEHPPEELLEVLVIAGAELSPELHQAITEHARGCHVCQNVLGLLLQFHRALESETGSPRQAEALVRAIFTEEETSVRRKGDAAGV